MKGFCKNVDEYFNLSDADLQKPLWLNLWTDTLQKQPTTNEATGKKLALHLLCLNMAPLLTFHSASPWTPPQGPCTFSLKTAVQWDWRASAGWLPFPGLESSCFSFMQQPLTPPIVLQSLQCDWRRLVQLKMLLDYFSYRKGNSTACPYVFVLLILNGKVKA